MNLFVIILAIATWVSSNFVMTSSTEVKMKISFSLISFVFNSSPSQLSVTSFNYFSNSASFLAFNAISARSSFLSLTLISIKDLSVNSGSNTSISVLRISLIYSQCLSFKSGHLKSVTAGMVFLNDSTLLLST